MSNDLTTIEINLPVETDNSALDALKAYGRKSLEAEKASGNKFISVKAGLLSSEGTPIANNKLKCIIIADVFANTYYKGDYDPKSHQTPSCYSFGELQKDMVPHADVATPVAPACEGCEFNQFGSAEKGAGKRCKNSRRLACIGLLSDTEITPEYIRSAEVRYLNLPVMSSKGFSQYVKKVATFYDERPVFAVYTEIGTQPDPRSQFVVTFRDIGLPATNLIESLVARHEQERKLIDFGYATIQQQEDPQKETGKRSKF